MLAPMEIFILFLGLVGLLYLIIWLRQFVDILKSEFPGNEKIVWLLAVILVPVAGMLAYLYIGKRKKLIK